MENTEKYNNAFVQVFGAKAGELNDNYGKETVEEWDSVHQLSLISELEAKTFLHIESFDEYQIYPANLFVTTKEQQELAVRQIQDDLLVQIDYFKSIGEDLKAQRIKERVEYDLEMIKELGHC